jgi:hypothetical protein
MSACSNCGRVLSCGCQKKVASDGKSVCKVCSSQYEATLASKAATPTEPQLNVWGKDRYKNLNKFIK